MYSTTPSIRRRGAFTLVEMIVVLAIILTIAALAAAFMPRVQDSTNLTRTVDSFEQWLLTAKMRAKHDQLATGIRFIPSQNDINPNNPFLSASGTYSEFQYIQQPDPLTGGSLSHLQTPGSVVWTTASGTLYLTGGICYQAPTPISAGSVSFYNVDFALGLGANIATAPQWLVQPGDYLELRNSGVYLIGRVVPPVGGGPANTLQLGFPNLTSPPMSPYTLPPTPSAYDIAFPTISPPPTSPYTSTTNYRIIRQPRVLVGEPPLLLPDNYAVITGTIPDTIVPGNSTSPTPMQWSYVSPGPSGYLEILFSPSGAVVGTNAGSGRIFLSAYDTTMNPFDMDRVGIIAVQTRTGFIGAFSAAPGAGLPGYNPFAYAQEGRDSGL